MPQLTQFPQDFGTDEMLFVIHLPDSLGERVKLGIHLSGPLVFGWSVLRQGASNGIARDPNCLAVALILTSLITKAEYWPTHPRRSNPFTPHSRIDYLFGSAVRYLVLWRVGRFLERKVGQFSERINT